MDELILGFNPSLAASFGTAQPPQPSVASAAASMRAAAVPPITKPTRAAAEGATPRAAGGGVSANGGGGVVVRNGLGDDGGVEAQHALASLLADMAPFLRVGTVAPPPPPT